MNLTGGMPSPPRVTPWTCSVVSAAIIVTRPLSLPAFAERLFRLLAVNVPIPMTCVQVLVRSDISISRGDAASPVSPRASRSFLVTSKEETSHQQNTHARCFPMGAASSRNQGADCFGICTSRRVSSRCSNVFRYAAFVGLVTRQCPSAIQDQLFQFLRFSDNSAHHPAYPRLYGRQMLHISDHLISELVKCDEEPRLESELCNFRAHA